MYNIHNKWDSLKVCMLGNNYAPEFFNGLDKRVADPLKRICDETLEDLDGYKHILQEFGVQVIQPELNPSERFLDNPHRYPRGPLQPRDNNIVLGNKCFTHGEDHNAIAERLFKYDQTNTVLTSTLPIPESKYNQVACFESGDWPSYQDYQTGVELKDFVKKEIEDLHYNGLPIYSATSFLLDDTLLINVSYDGKNLDEPDPHIMDAKDSIKTIADQATGRDLNIMMVNVEGHTDGNFHPIKPGAILSLYDVQNYADTFPGWDICYLPDQSWKKVRKWQTLKKKNKGKWWLAGEEDNDEFTYFVETWLSEWVGYVEETVFDVNVLVLDEHHVCVNNMNPIVIDFLKKHNMEPVHVPWRHRFFWDGGLHCITLDLVRE